VEPQGPGGVLKEQAAARPDPTGDLVEAIRRGDAAAFDRMARDHAPRLFRLALRLTGRREDAEDLVQDTLVRSLRTLRGFEGRAELSTYLVRALGNLWKNRLRARQRSKLVAWLTRGRGAGADAAGERPEFDPPDPSPGALEQLEADDRAAAVRRAVARLDPDRRLTLLLREVEELSYEEIASVTGVPVGTVRSRLARARDDLRRILGEAS